MVLDDTTNQFKMPLMRQFVMPSGARQVPDGQILEDSKMAVPVEKLQIAKDVENLNIVRDLQSKAVDEELVEKLLKTNIEVRYDERYIRELIKTFQIQPLPISGDRLRDCFEYYSRQFKKYTEEKVYSGIMNISSLIKSFLDYELALKFESGIGTLNHKIHSDLASCWELIFYLSTNIDQKKFTQEDLIFNKLNYQKQIA